MESTPRRVLPLLVLSLTCLICLAGALLGILRLAQAELSVSLLLWFSLPMIGLPLAALAAYLFYGLATARYRVDREGFALRWGLAFEQAPLRDLRAITPLSDMDGALQLPALVRFFGIAGRQVVIPGHGEVEAFATGDPQDGLLIDLDKKTLLITPLAREEFMEAFQAAARQGSFEDLPVQSYRPDLLINAVWRDRAARVMILLGSILPVGMVVYLSVRAGGIPSQVPFGFDTAGQLGPLVPAGRLLLLPMVALLVWVLDGVIGILLYRRSVGKVLPYAVWTAGVLTSALIWLAILQMISTV